MCRVTFKIEQEFDVKNVHKKVLSFVSSRRFGNNPFISRMFQPLRQNQTFTVHARQMAISCAKAGQTKAGQKACFRFMLKYFEIKKTFRYYIKQIDSMLPCV